MRTITLAVVLVLSLAPMGCTTGLMNADGLPPGKYMVGGGFMVNYVAPSAGTAILANKTNDQIMVTQSLDAGEEFEQMIDPSDEEVRSVLGDSIDDARFVLYFVPSKSEHGR